MKNPEITSKTASCPAVLLPFEVKWWRLFLAVFLCVGSVPCLSAAGVPTYQQLKSFGTPPSGGNPFAGLMQGTDGALYGTAYGDSNNPGTVFKLNPDGTGFTVLKIFDWNLDSTGGGYPIAGLMQGTDGALYGTASQGGKYGGGTVFRLNPDGTGFTISQELRLRDRRLPLCRADAADGRRALRHDPSGRQQR